MCIRLTSGAAPARRLKVALDLGQGFFQPAEVGVDPLVQGSIGGLAAVALGHQHLEQLPPARHQSTQMAGRLVRQGTHRWPDRLGEMSDRLGIQAVGLRQPAQRTGEAANLARVDHPHRQAGRGEGAGNADLQAAGGLEHDQRRLKGEQALDQRRHLFCVIVDGEALAGRTEVDVEPALRDVDADKDRSLVHDPFSLDAG